MIKSQYDNVFSSALYVVGLIPRRKVRDNKIPATNQSDAQFHIFSLCH